MPYCPKCDMEFIDGMTTCTDCGGPLAESKEAADAIKAREKEEALAKQRAEYEAMQAALMDEMGGTAGDAEHSEDSVGSEDDMLSPASPYGDIPGLQEGLSQQNGGKLRERTQIYVKKSQQYDDLKSSASAFLLVGGALLIFSILCWTNIIRLPMAGLSGIISRSVMTLLGIGSLFVAFTSAQSAKRVSGQIADEEQVTRQLINWFIENYSGEQLDLQIQTESGELSPEELSLKRFDLIQDLIITNHDISDQSYVDALAEEIYGKLYEN